MREGGGKVGVIDQGREGGGQREGGRRVITSHGSVINSLVISVMMTVAEEGFSVTTVSSAVVVKLRVNTSSTSNISSSAAVIAIE